MSEETLTEGMETGEEVDTTEAPEIPEGFDEELYDVESKSLRMDKVKERFESNTKEIENYKKQALDLRRKLSKGVDVPDSVDKYEFTPDAKYDKYLLNEESIEGQHINDIMGVLSQFCLDNGLSLDASKNLKTLALNYMEDVHILDTRTDEEIAKAKSAELEKQRKILGDNAADIIKENVDFYKSYGFFDKEEREYIMSQLGHSGQANKIFNKFMRLFNTTSSADIPQSSNVDASVEQLKNEYYDDKTTDRRREQIIKLFAEHGWGF